MREILVELSPIGVSVSFIEFCKIFFPSPLLMCEGKEDEMTKRNLYQQEKQHPMAIMMRSGRKRREKGDKDHNLWLTDSHTESVPMNDNYPDIMRLIDSPSLPLTPCQLPLNGSSIFASNLKWGGVIVARRTLKLSMKITGCILSFDF